MITTQNNNDAERYFTPSKNIGKSNLKNSFPMKLHELLENAVNEPSHSDIISWLPDGNAFKIHKRKEFCENIMKTYFKKQSQFHSFTRQVSFTTALHALINM
jgi:hypothetical protein